MAQAENYTSADWTKFWSVAKGRKLTSAQVFDLFGVESNKEIDVPIEEALEILGGEPVVESTADPATSKPKDDAPEPREKAKKAREPKPEPAPREAPAAVPAPPTAPPPAVVDLETAIGDAIAVILEASLEGDSERLGALPEAPASINTHFRAPGGFLCQLTVRDSDDASVLRRFFALTDAVLEVGGAPTNRYGDTFVGAATVRAAVEKTPREPAQTAPLKPLPDGHHRLLITKVKRTPEGRAELFGRGHKYPDLRLFELSDLDMAGIDWEKLEVGVETPCRFFAVYTLSDKLNQAGNPYKDVEWLEPA